MTMAEKFKEQLIPILWQANSDTEPSADEVYMYIEHLANYLKLPVDWGLYRMNANDMDENTRLVTFFMWFEDRSVLFLQAAGEPGSLQYNCMVVPTTTVITMAEDFVLEYRSTKKPEGSHTALIQELIKKHNEKETQVLLREPDLLMVITGGEMAYTREDGVKIIPIGTLRD